MGPLRDSPWRAGLGTGVVIGVITAAALLGLVWLFDHISMTWVL